MPKRRARRKRRHTVLRVVLATSFVLALVTAMSVAYLYRQFDSNIRTIEGADEILGGDRPDKVTTGDGEPINVLLVGSDKEDGGTRRSDTTILMHLSGNRDFAYGISLPRDALVDRPDCTDPETRETIPGESLSMFNDAYAYGGPLCTQKTVEQLTDVHIDTVIEMDFEGFEAMVDAVDGVEVCLTEPIRANRYNKALDKEGTFTATGEEALIYVRERHQLSTNGDVGRMKRQQAFLASLANKVISAETLTSPGRVVSFLDAVTSSVTITDEDYANLGSLADLGAEFNGIGLDNIQFITVPNAEYEPNPNRLVWTDEAADLWELVRDDQPLTSEFLEGALTAEEEGGSIASSDAAGTAPSSPSSSSTSPSETASTEAADEDPAAGLTPEEIAEQNGLCS